MNKKINYIRKQRNYYSNKIHKLYKLKKLLMSLAMFGILCWSVIGIYSFKLALNFLWLEGINIFLVALIFVIDWEQETNEQLYENKQNELKQTIKQTYTWQ